LRQFRVNKNFLILSVFLALLFVLVGLLNSLGNFVFYFGILIFVLPYLYLGAKAVDEVCMVKKISSKKLTEGDWLYESVRIGNKVIKKSWEGLNKKEIELLKKKKFVLIRQGIPFSPVFLISFLVLVFLWFKGIDFGFFGF